MYHNIRRGAEWFLGGIASLILVRARKIFSFPFLALITLLVGSHGSPPILTAILTVLISLTATVSVYVYNDVCDLKMDRLNPQKRDRPLTSGKVTVKEAMRLVYISGFIALALNVLLNMMRISIKQLRSYSSN